MDDYSNFNPDLQRAFMIPIRDTRRFTLESLKDYIAPFTGRPVRDLVIGKEDLMNLKIAIGTTTTVDDFLRAV
jgi:hypothetical protein